MEHRQTKRYEVQIPLLFSGSGIAGAGMVRSLSEGGCTILTLDEIPPDTALVLHLHLPTQDSPLKIDVAVVRWSKERERGLEFQRVVSPHRERLRRFLSNL